MDISLRELRKCVKDEFKFVVFRKELDDEDDHLHSFEETEEDAAEAVKSAIASYGDIPQMQYYYKPFNG